MLVMNALLFGLALAGPVAPGVQTKDPCTLLTPDEVQTLAPGTQIPAGVSETVSGPMGVVGCRYEWGAAGSATAGKYTFTVTLSDAARAYPGAKPADIQKGIARPVDPGDPPAILIPKTGDRAYYKSSGKVRSDAVALVKGSILEIRLDGPGATGKRTQVISLLRTAVERL